MNIFLFCLLLVRVDDILLVPTSVGSSFESTWDGVWPTLLGFFEIKINWKQMWVE